MESNSQRPPLLGHLESPDGRCLSELITILIKTIQEAKDRISRVESIFCSQLFPHFQLTSQSLQNIGNDAQQAAEDVYKEKKNDMLLQIRELQCKVRPVLGHDPLFKPDGTEFINKEMQSSELQTESKQKNPEINEGRKLLIKLHNFIALKESLTQSYENTVKELEEKDSMLLKKQKALEFENEELQLLVAKKSEEVDKAVELNQSRGFIILQKEEKLRAYEKKNNELVIKLDDAEKKAELLRSTLGLKIDEIDKGKEMQGDLQKKIECQASENMNTKQLLSKYEKETILLATKVKGLSEHADEIEKEVSSKINEVEKKRQLCNHLVQQIDVLSLEKIKVVQEFEESEKEMKKLVDEKKFLEEKVDKLEECLYERNRESSEGMQLHGKLLQQIQAKNSEVFSEKRKRRDAITAYKRLKSRYNLRFENCNHGPENMITGLKTENEVLAIDDKCPTTSSSMEVFAAVNSETKRHGELQKLGDTRVTLQKSSPLSPTTSSILILTKCPTSSKSNPHTGKKRHISHWRDTRTCQSRFISDPHDDLLDTPLQNLKNFPGKAIEEDNHDLPKPGPMTANIENVDSQTQDMNRDALPQKQQIKPLNAKSSVFKYAESTRRKSERDNLKGVECKQCSKFYDTVLPDSTKHCVGNKKSVRCEHHDGISRHRYRYAPPLTPDGFWNIDFESET